VYCGEHYWDCEIRLSLEGDLYIFEHRLSDRTLKLYVSRYREGEYDEYDLYSYGLWTTGEIDFVPFSEQNIVIFYANTGSTTLSRLNLTTGEMTLMPQTNEHRRIVACNGLWRGRVGDHKHISRLGVGNELIYCPLSEDGPRVLVNVVDVITLKTVQTHDFDIPWGGAGSFTPWYMLTGGQDGHIYIDYPNNTLLRSWPGLDLTEFPGRGWRLFRYVIAADQWTVQNFAAERMKSSNYPPSGQWTISRLESVLSDGSLIHQHGWAPLRESARWELSRFTADFELMERIASADFDEPLRFGGVSSDGMVLLLGENGLGSAKVVWFGQGE
jgi:hypothetical protein